MDTRTFVSDSLLQFTGASDPTIVDFVIATASDAKSAGVLREKLAPFLEGGDEHGIDTFCADLYGRVSTGARKSQHRSSAAAAAEPSHSSKTKYRLVEMENDDDADLSYSARSLVDKKADSERRRRNKGKGDTHGAARSRWEDEDEESHHNEQRSRREKDASSRKRDRSRDADGHRRSRKLRRRDDDFEDRWGDEEIPDEEEERFVDEQASPVKRTRLEDGSASPRSVSSSADLDEDARAERDRQRDLKERDEFAKRLAEKEDSKSKKKIVEDRTRRAGDSSRRVLANDADARSAAMPDLRLRSRQEYLKKREVERIALLRKQVAEESIID